MMRRDFVSRDCQQIGTLYLCTFMYMETAAYIVQGRTLLWYTTRRSMFVLESSSTSTHGGLNVLRSARWMARRPCIRSRRTSPLPTSWPPLDSTRAVYERATCCTRSTGLLTNGNTDARAIQGNVPEEEPPGARGQKGNHHVRPSLQK